MKAPSAQVVEMDRSSFFAITFLAVAINFAFGLPLPSLKAYVETSPSSRPPGLGKDEMMFGLSVTLFNVGAFLGALASGYINSRWSTQRTTFVFNVIGLVGSVLYGLGLDIFTLFVGRFLSGAWLGGMNVVIRAYISRTTPKDKIIQRMSLIAGACTIIWAVSPAIGGAFAVMPTGGWGTIRFDTYRAPGWCLAVIALSCMLVQLLLIDDRPPVKEDTMSLLDDEEEGRPASTETSPLNPSSAPARPTFWDTNSNSTELIVSLLVSFFVFSFGFMALETLATPLMADQFGIDIQETSYVYIVAGISSTVSYVAAYFVNRKKLMTEFWQCIVALAVLLIGFAFLADFQSIPSDPCQQYTCAYTPDAVCNATLTAEPCRAMQGCLWNPDGTSGPCSTCAPICHNPSRTLTQWQLYIGFTCNNLAFTVGRLIIGGFYAKLIKSQPPRPAEAWMMAFLETSGNVARIAGPMGVVALYQAAHNHTWISMIVLIGLTAMVLLHMLRLHRTCHSVFFPPSSEKPASTDATNVQCSNSFPNDGSH